MVRIFLTKTTGRVLVVRLEPGEDILKSIVRAVNEHSISSGYLSLIGAVSSVHLGYFDRDANVYRDFTIHEDLEIVSCVGNVSKHNGDNVVHAHVVASNEKGQCYGGHLMEGCTVSVTIEIVITEIPLMVRCLDEATGLNLLDL
ncbi:DNA-binding protein [Candidatus Thorarchaeota archaeon]|nr:MAG: DNA-binding protein [Candidatus Thorarchaeota archaeon]